MYAATGNYQEAFLTYCDIQAQCGDADEASGDTSVLILNGLRLYGVQHKADKVLRFIGILFSLLFLYQVKRWRVWSAESGNKAWSYSRKRTTKILKIKRRYITS